MALAAGLVRMYLRAPKLQLKAATCSLCQTRAQQAYATNVPNRTRKLTRTQPPSNAPRFEHYTPVPKEAWVVSFETGNKLGIVRLSDFVFGARPRVDIIHRVVVWQRAKRRAGTAKVKDRSEVRGGGRKPWRQKGSGRARQGSIRAPHWRGGGVVHGPRGPTSYDYTLPKKVRSLGLRSALSVKYAQGDLHVVDSLQLGSNKEQDLAPILQKHGWDSVLLVEGGEVHENLCLASSDLDKVDVLPSKGLNVYSILLRSTLVLSLGAVRMLEERLQDSAGHGHRGPT